MHITLLISAIHASQFTTPCPRHINDREKTATLLSDTIPNTDSHTIHLVKSEFKASLSLNLVAAVVNRLYSHAQGFKRIPYNHVLQADCELREAIEATPNWMTDRNVLLDPSVPSWVEWQRHAFMVGDHNGLTDARYPLATRCGRH